MKDRCFNPKNSAFKNYGGRGVTVCDRWIGQDGAANFIADMGQPPDGLTLERNDVNGNYEPSNCCWASLLDQGRNKRNNHLITHNGETKTLSEWAEQSPVSQQLIRTRLVRYGWDFEAALMTPAMSLSEAGRRGKKIPRSRTSRAGV